MMWLVLSLQLFACSPREFRHGDIVPTIEPPLRTSSVGTGTTGDTGEWWTRTTTLECPGPYPTGMRIGDDEGWAIENDMCVVSAPPPLCEERHLGVLEPPAEGARTCECDLDCPVGTFCGAGHCRSREGALLTVCVEEVWYERPAYEPPTTQILVAEPAQAGDPYGINWSRALYTPPGDSCRDVVRHCEQFAPVPLIIQPAYTEYREDVGEECDAREDLWGGTYWVSDPYALPFSAHANQGCVPYPIHPLWTEDSSVGTLWVSVWYP